MAKTIQIRKGSDQTADVYSRYEQTQKHIAFFEAKKGKQTVHNFLNKEDSLNKTNLALWAFGQAFLQKQLREKSKRLASEVKSN